jgi:hypothetical protein
VNDHSQNEADSEIFWVSPNNDLVGSSGDNETVEAVQKCMESRKEKVDSHLIHQRERESLN